MAEVLEKIDIDVPVETVYREWADLTGLPHILDFVKEVRPTGPDQTHWTVSIAGQEREYDARTTEQIDNERIAWTSVGGEVQHGGVVTFHRLSDTTSRLTLQLDWQPEGVVETVGAAVGVDSASIAGNLKTFKDRLEGAAV